MAAKEKEIAIYVGTFDADTNKFNWKKESKYDSMKSAIVSFKALCAKCVKYSYDDLMKIYDSPRLDIELRQGANMVKWFGVYEKDVDLTEEK